MNKRWIMVRSLAASVIVLSGCIAGGGEKKKPAPAVVGGEKKQEAPAPAPAKIDGYAVVDFKQLAGFKYEVPDDPITDPKAKDILEKNEIPKPIKKLDKKKIAVTGYMLPLRVENGKITEFLVLRDQSLCCTGAVPKINEWINVRMPKGRGVKPLMDVRVTFFGVFKVGEVLENGYLVGIYEMDGHKINGPGAGTPPTTPN
ncbi:MAG: DUF3299 domain-containing protein [Verrucomicrobiota bacterium]|nr:DUF3299 domain-containing protein [Verrucomicrobiota bacterium]